MKSLTDLEIYSKLSHGNEQAFNELFCRYYAALCAYAYRFVGDEEETRELVQEVFVQLWEKRRHIEIHTSVKSYLFRAVKNQLINWQKHVQVEKKYLQKLASEEQDPQYGQYFVEVDLQQKIEDSIDALPPKRKEIFKLSREEGKKYHEIAEQLGLSVKTVETQMGLALKQLREDLKEYRHLLIGLSFFQKNL